MNKTNKKGSSEIWWIIAAAVIAFLVVIFVLMWFKGSGEKIFGGVNTKIGELDKPLDLPAPGTVLSLPHSLLKIIDLKSISIKY